MYINNDVTNYGGLPSGGSGTLANRPAAGVSGRIYIATDTLELYRDTGLAWTTIGGPGSGTVTGTGTPNEITYWNGISSIGSLTTTIYPDLTELSFVKGVTSSIQSQLNNKQPLNANLTSLSGLLYVAPGGFVEMTATNTFVVSPITFPSGSGAAGQATFWTGASTISGDNAFHWDNTNKRLGINTVNPGSRLDIHGTSVLVELNGVTTNNAYIDYKNAGAQKWTLGNTYAANTNRYSIFNAGASAEVFTILQSGNIGISQPAPAGQFVVGAGQTIIGGNVNNGTDALQVIGSAIATRLKVNTGGQTFEINNVVTGAGFNILIGDAGSTYTTGEANTALGRLALDANTSGGYNVAIGFNVLSANTTGSYNVALGSSAMASNTTGSNNVAHGEQSLSQNTTGSKNVGHGVLTLFNNLTGSSNIALGYEAGRKISGGGNLTVTDQSIYIGEDTRANANNATNEIVIGHAAIGNGSNTVTIGNSSNTKTILTGDVGIGTANNGTDGGVVPRLAVANPSNADKFVGIGFDNAGDYGFIHAIHRATAWKNLALQAFGGNVGIGTTSPAAKLDVITTNRTSLSATGSGINVNYNGTNTGEYATIGFSWSNSIGNTSTQWGMGLVGTNYAAGTAALIHFTNGAERMRITSAGDVGIGYTTPNLKLAVNGSIYQGSNTSNALFDMFCNGNLYTGGISPTVITVNTTPVSIVRTTTGYYCTAGASVLNLPAVSGLNNMYYIINASGGNITVNRAGSDTILDLAGVSQTSITIANNERAMLYQGGGTITFLIFQA